MSVVYSFLLSLIMSVHFQSDIPYSTIENAFATNDAKDITALGKEKILINVLGKEGVYSQSQANLVLKDFFTKKPGTSFKFIFKGKEASDGSFAIGTYQSKSEEFRVTIHFKKVNGDFLIESLSIEKS
jgi:hypothetical protein